MDIYLFGNEKLEPTSLNKYFAKRSYVLFLRKGKVLSLAVREFIKCIAPAVMEQFNAEMN